MLECTDRYGKPLLPRSCFELFREDCQLLDTIYNQAPAPTSAGVALPTELLLISPVEVTQAHNLKILGVRPESRPSKAYILQVESMRVRQCESEREV